jgi:glycosyltransferase involved in cell wall biosynthesis
MNALPLVSCIMPTANRRAFVPRAIQYFLRQDYPEKELVILDDGEDSVADLIPADPRIRYLRETRRRTIGAKPVGWGEERTPTIQQRGGQ